MHLKKLSEISHRSYSGSMPRSPLAGMPIPWVTATTPGGIIGIALRIKGLGIERFSKRK